MQTELSLPSPLIEKKKTFLLLPWKQFATSSKTHSLVCRSRTAKHYIGTEKSPHPHQDDYFLKCFLKMADISGLRQAVNVKEQRLAWNEYYMSSKRHLFWRRILGENFEVWDSKRFLKENGIGIKENDYPIWRKPVIKRYTKQELNLWGIKLIKDQKDNVITFSNEQFMLELASECDILVLDKNIVLKPTFSTIRVGEVDFCEFKNNREYCPCFSSESWNSYLTNEALEKLDLSYKFHEHILLKFSLPSSSSNNK